jgi:hypothetical protein
MKTFPIMAVRDGHRAKTKDFTIPWALIAPHEKQAQRNHYQTLERLAERGGLSAREALAVIEDRPFGDCLEDEEAELMLASLAQPHVM